MDHVFRIVENSPRNWEILHNDRVVINAPVFDGIVAARNYILEFIDSFEIGQFTIEVASYVHTPFEVVA